ncbi:MAG: DUF2141 domain-containing protein [Kiloniellales bacterium]
MNSKWISSTRAIRIGLGLLILGLALSDEAPTRAALAGSASLTVIVENLRNTEGTLRVAIWDSEDGFADGDQSVAGAALPASDEELRFVFDNLAPGRYAVAVYHDENDNGKFDRTLIGLPAEGLGFSNDAWLTVLGAPSFERAAIELDGTAADAVINLRY